jgi:vitamin B12 transporter
MYSVLVAPVFILFALPAAGLETVRVVGTHLGLGAESLTGQVSVIDRDEIAALNKTSVEQLLQALPGVSINQQGGAGGVTSLYVRGGEANFTVVMIDGVQVNNPTNTRGGSFDFSTLDISTLERIELIRGPQSAIYGGDALSGVLNLVTRQPSSDNRAVVRTELGSDEYYRLAAQGELALGETGGLSLQIGHNDAGEVVAGSDHQIDFINGKLNYQLKDTIETWASFRYTDSERANFPEDSGGPDFAVYRTRDEAESEDISAQLGLSFDLNSQWTSLLTASWFETDSSETSPGIFPGLDVPPNGSKVNFDRAVLNWNNQFLWQNGRMSAGFDFKREQGESQGYFDFGVLIPTYFELEQDTLGAFWEIQQQLGLGLSLSLGLRYDEVDGFDRELSPRLGALYQFENGKTRLRANWGTGFKPPSFFALAHPLVGNPDLKPETARSWDVGIEQELGQKLQLNLVWFDNDFEDLIDFDDESFRNVNREQVESRGMEFSFQYPVSDQLSLQGHATYTDTEIVNSDETLRGRPEWKAGAQLFYHINTAWQLSAEYLWVDQVTEASRHTGENVDYTLDAYQTVDISLAWQAHSSVRLELAISNLLDEEYQQAVGFPAAGVFPRLAIELGF